MQIATRLWEGGDHVSEFASRTLRPVETVLLARYREALSGRVLEIGCGAGRLLGYVLSLGGEVHGIDISPLMVDHCRRVYPGADVRIGDLRHLQVSVDGRFDAVIAAYNVLDVLDDHERRRVLAEVSALLAPAGVLIFSSHNLADASGSRHHLHDDRGLARKLVGRLDRPPSSTVALAKRLPRRLRNRRRLGSLERHETDHAILNDAAMDYGLLHYYIRRDDQERQLDELGFDLLECLDLEGRDVPVGSAGDGPELHYVARPRRL